MDELLSARCEGSFHKRAMDWALRTLVAAVVIAATLGCNIDTREPYATFNSDLHDQPGSYFGYTVLQHYNNWGWWVLVGAPRGTTPGYQPTADKPGALWRCRKTSSSIKCENVNIAEPSGTSAATLLNEGIIENADNAWMGVSLARQLNQQFADVTVCGHRFGNDISVQPGSDLTDEKVDRFIQGLCYSLDADFRSGARFNPCAGQDAWRDGVVVNETVRWQGWCQFGVSATYTIETADDEPQSLVVGAVGSYDWTGTTFKQDVPGLPGMSAGDLSAWNEDSAYKDFYQYVGYSTTVGHFMSSSTQEGATGAPRAGGLVGRVYIYDLQTFTVYQELSGEMMNTYYGGAIEAVDINLDGLTDLLVGAPLYSTNQDEGRVYVYINHGGSSPLQLHQTLDGSSVLGSRFGHVITSVNDLSGDMYPEIAVGAPYEGGGVVYIYQSTSGGIDEAYSQRIDGTDIDPSVQTFGSAISGGYDFDSNAYPDISIGAYANDSVYLYKTRPLLDLLVNLVVTPDPMDPENPSCVDEVLGPCLEINVCYTYEGPYGASLPASIEVIFDIEVDKVKTADGRKPRFLLEQDGEMVAKINKTETVFKDRDTCFNYTVYLQTTATDFLTALPIDLTYILMDYPVEPPARGDKPQRFPKGLAPVMKSYQCAAVTKKEEVNFVRDCGADAICATDIRLEGNVEIEGDPTAIVVGGPSRLYIDAIIRNVGEEAHQAYLTINHATDMRYEGLEVNEVSCVSPDGSDDPTNCDAGQVRVFCEPTFVNLDTSSVSCNLGNPMKAFTSSKLRLRFDIGGLIWKSNRIIPISMEASTSSVQRNETMRDNRYDVTYELVVEADVGVIGTTAPESVYYSTNSSRYADDTSAKEALDEAVNMALTPDPTSNAFNDTYIGAPFTLLYTLTNDGMGMLPFQSILTINIPWRMLDGEWLIFIKSITVSDRTGTGSCNTAEVLALQNIRLLEVYVDNSRRLSQAPEEDITRIFTEAETTQSLGCSKAKCVALTCHINPLQVRHSIEVRINALQWEHTLITRELGYVEVLTEASVVAQGTNSNEHGQGLNESPDRIQLPVKMFTDMAGAGTVPIWVIILSIIGGLLLLILLILIMWKCGFFKRKTREDWEIAASSPAAAPVPIKPVVMASDEMEGTDLPMMKGLAATKE